MGLSLNITQNFSGFNISYMNSDICLTKDGVYSPECLLKWFCPQIPEYLIHTGLIIIIVSVVVTWGLAWFLKHGYKSLDYDNAPEWVFQIFGDLRNFETRIYWDAFVRDKLLKVALGFIGIVIYFFWKK